MYAVRINPDSVRKPKNRKPGCVWVTSKDKCADYGLEQDRLLFSTIQQAKSAKCEPWEIVVKVEVEK